MKDTKLALLIAAILIVLAAVTREDPAASESWASTQVVPWHLPKSVEPISGQPRRKNAF